MAYSRVLGVAQLGSGTSAGVNTSTADLLVAYVVAATTADAPSSNPANTWFAAGAEADGGFGFKCRLWYAWNPSVSASQTFTANGTTPLLFVEAWSGSLTASDPLDQVNTPPARSNPVQPGSVTPSANDELLVTATGGSLSSTPGAFSIDGGFTVRNQSGWSSGAYLDGAIATLVQTTAAAANPTWTDSDTQNHSANIATFKSSGGGGGGGNPWYAYAQQ